MTVLLALLVQTVAASPVVLHQGDEESVRRAVAEAANLRPSELTLTHFDEFRSTIAPSGRDKRPSQCVKTTGSR